jgi:hypothetical protein
MTATTGAKGGVKKTLSGDFTECQTAISVAAAETAK